MRLLKQSTSYNLDVFMTDSGDHVSGKTGLTLTIEAGKDGGAFSSISPTVTERTFGWYQVALTTTHTNTVGDLKLHITGTGADPADVVMQVRANVLGDTLPSNVTQFGGSNGTFASGIPETKVASIAANAITATSIAADAITDAKVASDVTIASVTGAVGSVASGGITSGSFASGAITAAAIAADAIGASELAADAVTEIQSGLATAANLATLTGYVAALAVTTGTVTTDGGNSATSFETSLSQTTNDYWKDAFLLITSGTLAGQIKKITGYNGTTKIVTVSGGYTGTPADGVSFSIINR